jgi:hypothetical protein
MMFLGESLHQTLCRLSELSWKPCVSQWQDYISPEALTNVFAAILGAVVGALAGGVASYYVQQRVVAEQRADRETENKRLLEERLITFVMTTQRIIADMRNILNLINIYKQSGSSGSKLWQVVHTIHFTPGLKVEFSYLDCVARLGSATLINSAMHLYGEYQAVVDRVSFYNALRDRHLQARRNAEDFHGRIEDETNMQILAEFIEGTAHQIIAEAAECQHLVYRHSVSHFGSGEFLKLKNDEPE